MASLGFESFTKKIYIRTSTDKVYHCWATQEGICSWFLREASYKNAAGIVRAPRQEIEKGDSYTWQWHN
ncbi:MAG: hypothetical protein KJO86_00750, partial [Muriicola sp.]|nr:hypothetical protein [Muriicola sp.]